MEVNLTQMLNEMRDALVDVRTSQKLAERAQEQTHSEVVRLRKIIIGESEPEHGVLMRLSRAESNIKDINKERATVRNWAFGAISGAVISIISTAWNKLTT
jgi:hypothetical protein